jgi:hypothetical protein
MPPSTAQEFAHAARAISAASAGLGLTVPSFRSPPRLRGVDRSLRRRAIGAPVVAVRLGERPVPAVVADMIDGVVTANGLTGADAERVRRRLWAAVEPPASAEPRRLASVTQIPRRAA